MGDKIAFKGEAGDLAYEAAISRYPDIKAEPVPTFKKLTTSVEIGEASKGIIPFESSSGGRFIEPIEVLANSKATIIDEIMIESRFVFSGMSIKREKIEKVFVTTETAYSCQNFIAHLKAIQVNLIGSLSSIIEEIKSDEKLGIICSESFASIHDLIILQRGIQDHLGNTIRFVVISLIETMPTEKDKTSLLFNVKHQPGALFKTLGPIARAGLQMVSLESIPIKYRPWQYSFLADIMGHSKDMKVNDVLREMREYCSAFRILGSYPSSS